jgi:hypothetical protein
MPVLSKGYVVGLQIFSPNLLTLNQTGPEPNMVQGGLPNPNPKTISIVRACR